MVFYIKVLIALISSLTLYVGNVYNLPPESVCVCVGEGEVSGPSDPLSFPMPLARFA